jgi:chitinase
MGVPGNVNAGRGYAPPPTLCAAIDVSSKCGTFGGVMIWDASQAYTNGNFIGEVKNSLRKAAPQSKRTLSVPFQG